MAVGTDRVGADAAAAALVERGAVTVVRHATGRGRVLVHGGFGAAGGSASAVARVVAELREQGWSAVDRPAGGGHLSAWQANNAPLRIGARLVVCFPWTELDRDALPPGVAVVEIDPGAGFGTGRHPSTRLLLAALEARLRGGERVADVGCGSGVLAVAAARLGAAHVSAVDVAEPGRRATVANAAGNGVAGVVALPGTGSGVDDLQGDFDVIVANIGAAPLVELAADLRARLRPGGWIGLSGLSPAQLSRVAAAYRPLREVARPTDGEWAALLLAAGPVS